MAEVEIHKSGASDDSTSNQRGLSTFVTSCFTLNYLIGTGFLTLPWAFERAGLVLSALGMVFVCFVSNLASDYVLSSMARAEALTVYLECHGLKRGDKVDDHNVANRQDELVSESTALLSSTEPKQDSTLVAPPIHDHDYGFHATLDPIETPPTISTWEKVVKNFNMNFQREESFDSNDFDHSCNRSLVIKERKYEMTELCQIFLGDVGLRSYGVAVALDIYGFLWAYSSVFSAAMSHAFPLLGPDVDCYPAYICVFALIVVPMSLLELSEQAIVQVFLSGCRIVMILLMVISPLVATFFGSRGGEDQSMSSAPHFGDQTEPMGAPWIDISNVHEMIPVLVFAVLFHQAIPGLADEMTEKSKVGTIFGYTMILCAIAYSLIGYVVGWYFGEEIYESSNLNWGVYHAGTGQRREDEFGEVEWVNAAWWAQMISIFVVCFPAIDVISAYPLYALVLGNSLMGMVYADNIEEVQHNRRIKLTMRILAAVPPIIGALFVRNLGIITDYSGLTGLAIAFCFPPLLYIYSGSKLKGLEIPQHTRYERIGSSIGCAKVMFVFGVLTIVYCFILLSTKG